MISKVVLTVLIIRFAGSTSHMSSTHKVRERMKLISGGAPTVQHGILSTTNAPAAQSGSSNFNVQYSDPAIKLPYESDASIYHYGMGQLYQIVDNFLKMIMNKNAYPESLIVVKEDKSVIFGDVSQNYQEWLKFYAGPLALIAAGLLFIILIPIIGLFFCCCRCAGKCGARSKLEKRHNTCKRFILALFLAVIAVLLLFGLVCAFVTNKIIKEGTDRLSDSAKMTLSDTDLYLNNTKIEVDTLLVKNYQELENSLNSLLSGSGDILKNKLSEASHAAALSNLTALASGLDLIRKDLADISATTRKLQSTAVELGEALDQTRDELLRELNACRIEPACYQLLTRSQVHELRVVQNFSELPDVSRTFASISNLVGSGSVDGIQEQVLQGQRNLDSIRDEIMKSVSRSVPEINQALEQTGEELKSAAEQIKEPISTIQKLLNEDELQSNLKKYNSTIVEYGNYRYYAGLAMNSLLLIILFSISAGLFFGLCGKRPEDAYGDHEACSTVCGGRFLMTSVWLMFLLGSILMAVNLVYFVAGVFSTTAVCRPLHHPNNSQIINLLDTFVPLNRIYGNHPVDLTISQVITMCHHNRSLYETMKLENVFDINDVLNYRQRFQVDSQIARFKNGVNVHTERIQVLTPDARRRLKSLAESPVNDIQFSDFTKQLSSQVTNINLQELSKQLKIHADKIPDRPINEINVAYIRRLLRTKAQFLELLQRGHVQAIQEDVAALEANVSNLRKHLQFNNTGLRTTVRNLIEVLDSAQRYLAQNGTQHLRLLIDEFTDDFMAQVDDYLHRVVDKTKQDVGRCGVLSNVYNTTVSAVCGRLVDPLNGLWASIGWSLLLFIPALIICIKLSSLYQSLEAYSPPGYPEAEYLYDAYADRDSIPLAAASNRDKKRRGRSEDSYDNANGGGYLQDYSAHLGRSDRPVAPNTQDNRFADMAPKQWDTRAGPPGYHAPSTEYERPPPYYYPGPG